jgi:Acyl-CoA dehydrogenase, N-terminal domain
MKREAIDATLLPGSEERTMLRDSVRGFLGEAWPAAEALKRSGDPAAMAALWQGLVGQGLASLGSEPTEGRLREIVLVMEELGRAACPAPMLGAALCNLTLARAGSAQALAWLEQLHAGECRIAWPPRV